MVRAAMFNAEPLFDKMRRTCKYAVERKEVFAVFKKTGHYKEYDEHVPAVDGEVYAQALWDSNPEWKRMMTERDPETREWTWPWEEILGNDKIGTPERSCIQWVSERKGLVPLYCLGTTNRFFCSPTTLRTMFYVMTYLQNLKDAGVKKARFIEIGGRYGSFAYFTSLIAHKFDVEIMDYHIYDFPEIARLSSLYLDLIFPMNDPRRAKIVCHEDVDPPSTVEEGDVKTCVVSLHQFSQLGENGKLLKEMLKEGIVGGSDHGFMIWTTPIVFDALKNVVGSTLIVDLDSPHPPSASFPNQRVIW